jgi:hypothetical protein
VQGKKKWFKSFKTFKPFQPNNLGLICPLADKSFKPTEVRERFPSHRIVMPAKAGIQVSLRFLDYGSAPASPGCPESRLKLPC